MAIEITTQPRSRRWHLVAGRLALVTAFLALGLLLPASLGLSQHVVADDAMDNSVSRGSLVFGRDVRSAEQLRPGDVVAFVPPDDAGAAPVARRVVEVQGSTLVTQGDARAADDPWVVEVGRVETSLVVVAVPYAGYPQLVATWLTPSALVALLGALALGSALAARRETTGAVLVVRRGVDRHPGTAPA